jgi:hypothetical protein
VADGGYYCATCGLVQPLGSFRIVCRGCGASGLRGFGDRPKRVVCPMEGCDWTGWDDGEVNDDLKRHLRTAHDTRIEPEWRVADRARVAHLKIGTGTRSWSAACGQYLRSQGRPETPDARRCARCERRASGSPERHADPSQSGSSTQEDQP